MKSYLLWLVKFISKLLIFLILLPILIAFTIKLFDGKALEHANLSPSNKVGVITLGGPIMTAKTILESLHNFADDDNVAGIVLRVDSPGGAVAPSQEIYHAINELKAKKPIVVSMGSVAASGGLYVSLSASRIYLQEGTQTGSIGVIAQLPNFNQVKSKIGFDIHTVKSGALKDVGNPFREFSAKDREFLQVTVDKLQEQFFTAVVKGRNLDPAKVREFADGRLIIGSDAIKYGIADEIGDIYDSARGVFDLLGKPLPKGIYPKLVYKVDKLEKLKKVFGAINNFAEIFSYPELSQRKVGFYYF